jgi:hypothetical protein
MDSSLSNIIFFDLVQKFLIPDFSDILRANCKCVQGVYKAWKFQNVLLEGKLLFDVFLMKTLI